MAKIRSMNLELWAAWLAERPPVVRALCERLPPDRLYRMRSTGQRVTLYSYSEDGTVTVAVTGQWNLITFSRRVFGIDPDDLEECELPAPGEPLGELMIEVLPGVQLDGPSPAEPGQN